MKTKAHPSRTVLITGGRAPVALEIARVFWRAGYRVISAECLGHNLLTLSRSTERNYLLSSPKLNFAEFKLQILKIVLIHNVTLIIPTCEEVFYIAQFKNELPDTCTTYCPDFQTLRKLHSKFDFIEIAKKLNLNVPVSQRLKSTAQAKRIAERFGRLVLKPEYSRFGSRVHFISSQDRFPDLETSDSKAASWVAQQYIPGKQISTYSTCQAGKITAHCTYTSEYTLGPGSFIAFEALSHPNSLQWVETFVRNLNLTGQIAFDFIESSNDGKTYAIECNPRTTSGIHLLASQKNISRCFTDFEPKISPNVGERASSILAMALYALTNIQDRGGSLRWLDTIIKSKDIIFSWQDPLPFLSQFLVLGKILIIARRNNISVLEASTWDIEYNGR